MSTNRFPGAALAGMLRHADPGAESPDARSRQRGQVLPIFVIMSVVLLAGAALLTDVAWWWTMEQRMQRAADAGALAGAIYLPALQQEAFDAAEAEAKKNGFEDFVDGAVVTPRRDPSDPRKLIVDIDAPVGTFFAKVVGIAQVDVGVTGAASFVLPIPMGSPENYYGVFGKLRTPGGGEYGPGVPGVTGEIGPGVSLSGSWTTTSGTMLQSVLATDGVFARTNANYAVQWFGNFGLHSQLPIPSADQRVQIDGIEVLLDDAYVTGTCSNAFVEVHLSEDRDSNPSGAPSPNTLNDSPFLDGTPRDFVIGSGSDTSAFPIGRSWTYSDMSDSNFAVRLRGRSPCGQIRVDQVRVKVHYTTQTFVEDGNITDPYGQPLAPQGLWGTFINQGADKINGDAFLPKWDPGSRGYDNDEYDPVTYYNYAVEIPIGATGGELWIYDPVFCGTSGMGQYGTGDRWFGSSRSSTSAFYTLYDTNNTPYAFDDDVRVGASDALFKGIRASDESLNGPNLGPSGASTDCSVGATTNQSDGRYWHNRWWKLATDSGQPLAGGKTYRLHTRSTDPDAANAMNSANGHNSFSLWSKTATGGAPRVYGIGAMQAFTPLDANQPATFFLSQIEAEHAGKTMVISLWDPGDTGSLPATLQILKPTGSDYVQATFNFSAESVAYGAKSCTETGTDATSIVTNTGGNKVFNGCWLTIEIPLPIDYAAPRPSTETNPLVEGGWWKIKYIMGGNSSDDPAFDLTTWQVELRGNPVHLVPE